MFGRKKAERERIDALEAELAEVRERLAAADRDAAALRTNLTGVEATNRSLETRLASICAQGEEFTDRLGDLGDDVARVDARVTGVHDDVARVDARVTGVATELANQVTELGNDIDALHDPGHGSKPPAAGTNGHATDLDVDAIVVRLNDSVDEIVQEVLDEVESSTGRLAAEQARYQIQFRKELADVADRLRRPRAS